MHLPKRKTAWFKAIMTMDNIVCFSRKRQQFVEKQLSALKLTSLSFPNIKFPKPFDTKEKTSNPKGQLRVKCPDCSVYVLTGNFQTSRRQTRLVARLAVVELQIMLHAVRAVR